MIRRGRGNVTFAIVLLACANTHCHTHKITLILEQHEWLQQTDWYEQGNATEGLAGRPSCGGVGVITTATIMSRGCSRAVSHQSSSSGSACRATRGTHRLHCTPVVGGDRRAQRSIRSKLSLASALGVRSHCDCSRNRRFEHAVRGDYHGVDSRWVWLQGKVGISLSLPWRRQPRKYATFQKGG
jgi:hypothetical protein